MPMEAITFWCYALAASLLIWGALGLRFALSVLAANAVLACITYLLPEHTQLSANAVTALMLCYPLYWGVAFFLLRFVDALPQGSVLLRLALCCVLALACVLFANRGLLVRTGTLFYATYLSDPAKRPGMIAEVFEASDYQQVCLDSQATLMRLAVDARDADVAGVLLKAYARCYSASQTMLEAVRPLFAAGDVEAVAFLTDSGLKPSTLVCGSAYKGTALACAALEAQQPEIVRLLVSRAPDDARNLKHLSVIFDTLREEQDAAMLDVLRQAGLAAPEGPAAP